MKKLITLIVLSLIILIPLAASDGFDLFFDDTEVQAEEISTSSFDLSGKISTGLEIFLLPNNLSESEMDPFANLHLKLNYNHSSLGGNAELFLPALSTMPSTFKEIVKELSLSYFIPQGKIQAGYFIHRWGIVDTARVVDVINANDYRTGLSMDQREMKISEPMILAQFYIDRAQLEFIYKPLFTPIQMATNSMWDTSPDMSGLLDVSETNFLSPPKTNTLDSGSFGTRYSVSLGSIDAAIMYYRGYYERPGTRYDITPAPNPPYVVNSLETIYTMMNMIGTELNYLLGPFTFSAEGAFYVSEDTSGTDPSLYNSKFSYTGSVNYMMPSTTAYLTASYNGTSILKYDDSNFLDVDAATGRQDHNIILGVHIPFMKERLVVEAGFTYQIPTKGYALLSKIDYTLNDDITLGVKGSLFGTFDDTIFSLYNSWDSNDSLSLSLTYQY